MGQGKDVAQALSKLVTVMCNEEEEQAFLDELQHDHRTLKQKVIGLFIQHILNSAAIADNGEGWYDDRNRDSMIYCQKIRDFLEENGMIYNEKVAFPYI